jgi:RNA polymerase sigma-70 factor, ECF subfamily
MAEADELAQALEENREALFRFLLRLCGDRERAMDLSQETMVRAILGFKGFRGGSSFRTWLLAIAANLYRDGRRRMPDLPLAAADEAHDGGQAAHEAERRVEAALAMRALASLPEKKRKAVVLRMEFGYSYEEIARILRCPLGTVRSRIHQATEALRHAMGVDDGR